MTGACCMYDVLTEAVVGHIKSVYDVDAAAHCAVVIGKRKATDDDVSVTFSTRRLDSTLSSHSHSVLMTVHSCKPLIPQPSVLSTKPEICML